MQHACERTIKSPLASPSFTQPEDPIFSCYYRKTNPILPLQDTKRKNCTVNFFLSGRCVFPKHSFFKENNFLQGCNLVTQGFHGGRAERSKKHHPSHGESKRRLKELSLISMPKYAHSRSISTDEQLFVWSFYQPSSKALRWLKKLLKVPRGVLLSFVWSFMEIVFRCQHPSELIALLLR